MPTTKNRSPSQSWQFADSFSHMINTISRAEGGHMANPSKTTRTPSPTATLSHLDENFSKRRTADFSFSTACPPPLSAGCLLTHSPISGLLLTHPSLGFSSLTRPWASSPHSPIPGLLLTSHPPLRNLNQSTSCKPSVAPTLTLARINTSAKKKPLIFHSQLPACSHKPSSPAPGLIHPSSQPSPPPFSHPKPLTPPIIVKTQRELTRRDDVMPYSTHMYLCMPSCDRRPVRESKKKDRRERERGSPSRIRPTKRKLQTCHQRMGEKEQSRDIFLFSSSPCLQNRSRQLLVASLPPELGHILARPAGALQRLRSRAVVVPLPVAATRPGPVHRRAA